MDESCEIQLLQLYLQKNCRVALHILRAIALHQITSLHANTERRKLNTGWQVRCKNNKLLTYMLTFNYYEKTMGRLAARSAFGLYA